MDTAYIGKPISRVDGRAKVTGGARYAGEHSAHDLVYGYVVNSEIAKGKIKKIDASRALEVPGVLHVLTHENRPHIAWFDRSYRDETAPPGSPLRPLYDENILFDSQPVALVLAQTFELAAYAASLVRVQYERAPHKTKLSAERANGYEPKAREHSPTQPRGDAEGEFKKAALAIDAQYSSPVEHHNPIELFASTVIWEGDGKLTIYDKTQGAPNSHDYVCRVFGLSKSDVRVLSPYVGGAFGVGLRPQYQLFLATMAALELKRSVKVTLTRNQMFSIGHRPHTLQQLRLGASSNGRLTALMHDALGETSTYEDFNETVVNWSASLYKCDNASVRYQIAKLDTDTPIDMRAPGAALGVYALECAIDELAAKAGIDPLEFRIINYTDR
ncbi:MAG: xanthine dehydrogenase family protein molybdopterin-binding subunit, partial [Burkholderiaceae bacterium]